MSPSNSKAMVLPSSETSSESQVPSSVVKVTLRSDFKGRPFFSSFLSLSSFFWSFFSSALSFSWERACVLNSETSCEIPSGGIPGTCARELAAIPVKIRANINRYENRYQAKGQRLDGIPFMLFSLALFMVNENGYHLTPLFGGNF